jgi:hypothetical protein
MESNAFFERKVALTPKDMNQVGIGGVTVDSILLKTVRDKLEDRCSEHGFVLPGTVKLLSRSMGGFEAARFTGDAVYYVKVEGRVLYPADNLRVTGEVTRKNKMGLYVTYRNAMRIQVLRDLHLGNDEFEAVEIGDIVEVEVKKSFFQINDPYILSNGLFVRNTGKAPSAAATDGVRAAGGIATTGMGAGAGAGAGAGEEDGEGGEEGEEEAVAPAGAGGLTALEGAELVQAPEEMESDEQSE